MIGSTRFAHEIVQSVEIVKRYGGGVIDLGDGSMTGVEGFVTTRDGDEIPVSFKHLQPGLVDESDPTSRPKLGFVREIKQNEHKIRQGQSRTTKTLLGKTVLYLETPHTVDEVYGEMVEKNLISHLDPWTSPQDPGQTLAPPYMQMTLICTDGEVTVSKVLGYQVTRRPP